MSPKVDRRRFLRQSASAVPLLAHAALARAATSDAPPRELVPDPHGILDLPPGFSYRIISRSGDRMSDGYRVPGHSDGMGVFAGKPGEIVLMRNHEMVPGMADPGPYFPGQPVAPEAYDPSGLGGVTRIVMDERTLEVRSTNLVLTGTHWNCCGGLSPWGWLSCEETFVPNHGYVFVCPSDASRVAPARPIKGFGRFRHEAATTVPGTNITYLTEDIMDASFYRFVPHDPASPFEGKLQALAVRDAPRIDTGRMSPRQRVPITWVDVAEPDPQEDNVRLQAQAAGAAVFRRNEGIWLNGDELYFTATAGGPIARGQIFRLRHAPEDHAELELLTQATDPGVLDMPDNITVSPIGQIYACEDGLEGNFLRRITLDGRVIPFARNAVSWSEFAGVCFSLDGSTLFVNIQHDGLTLAVRGPFKEDAARDLERSSVPPHDPHTWNEGLLGLGGGLAVIALAALARRRKVAGTPP